MRPCTIVLATLLSSATIVSAVPSKPVIEVGADGFPGGHKTPEGAAADLARAFIRNDQKLFRSTCMSPFQGGEARKEYVKFLDDTAKTIAQQKKAPTPSPYGPKSITEVYAARHLSSDGPASYGYSVFGFRDVEFVDVSVTLRNGQTAMNRTFVIETPKGNWFVDPIPTASPNLSMGLNQETPSTQDFENVYTVVKSPVLPKHQLIP
jgi:hypothetical protein